MLFSLSSVLGKWSEFGPCKAKCTRGSPKGRGEKTRSRIVEVKPTPDGVPCDPMLETEQCEDEAYVIEAEISISLITPCKIECSVLLIASSLTGQNGARVLRTPLAMEKVL